MENSLDLQIMLSCIYACIPLLIVTWFSVPHDSSFGNGPSNWREQDAEVDKFNRIFQGSAGLACLAVGCLIAYFWGAILAAGLWLFGIALVTRYFLKRREALIESRQFMAELIEWDNKRASRTS
jgi:hypothetical protein